MSTITCPHAEIARSTRPHTTFPLESPAVQTYEKRIPATRHHLPNHQSQPSASPLRRAHLAPASPGPRRRPSPRYKTGTQAVTQGRPSVSRRKASSAKSAVSVSVSFADVRRNPRTRKGHRLDSWASRVWYGVPTNSNISEANELPGSYGEPGHHRHRATSDDLQPLPLRLNGTSGHTRRHPAAFRECLLSSRFRD
jgi:hypothetical protein